MRKFLDSSEARSILLEQKASPAAEIVHLNESLNRVLAEDVCASFPMPPFNKSPFDGYAFRGEETLGSTKERPAVFRIVGEVAAGDSAEIDIKPGTAVKIFTGAPVPPDADAVIKFEHTETYGDTLCIPEEILPDTNVIRKGEDYMAGTQLAEKGTFISPPHLGVFATQGIDRVAVYKKPVVYIISTGSELAEIGDPRPNFGIYNSSYYTLFGYLHRLGFEVRSSGIIEDDLRKISGTISCSMETADLVITTGGVSVGDYDFVKASAELIGANILFWKAAMKPGGAILAAEKNGKLLLGLSGNPAAAVMGLLVIALPYLRKLCGRKDVLTEEIYLPLKNSLPKTSPVSRLLRGHLSVEEGQAFFVENTGRGNGNIASFENCGLIGEVPACSRPLPAGAMIKAYRIAD